MQEMMDRKTYHTITYGCQMSNHDAEIIAGLLEDMGYSFTPEPQKADVIMINTCCVRETAENKIYGRIGELKHLKEANPNLILGISGCMAQQDDVGEKLAQRAPHLDIVIGTHNLHQLPRLIEEAKCSNHTLIEVWDTEGEVVEDLPARREDGLKAFVTIMYGCNNFCTYCIVPYVRGRERSRKPEEIEKELKQLAAEGYKEITLLGQNVNSYGKDLETQVDFADLLERLDKVEGIERIRYTTSHPRDFTDKLIDVIARTTKVCENFHLPVQAGSNKILEKMNRGYTKEYYLDLVSKIKEKVPNATLSTDLIVGFPGETEEDFEDTLDILRQVRYDAAYTFVYNTRRGTPAAEMKDQLSKEVKKDRIQRLIEVQNKISRELNDVLFGQTVEVLVEGPSKNNSEKLTGRTRTNKIVVFTGGEELVGKLVQVKVTESKTWNLEGQLLETALTN